MISKIMSFVCLDSCKNATTTEKGLAKCEDKSPFSRCFTGFTVSNAWTNLCNNMMEEKSGSLSRIPRKDSNASRVQGFLWVSHDD